jgi:RNA polymerase sigma-70 factor (ECF subfamily)
MEPAPKDRAWFIAQVREHQARLRASIRALGVRVEAVDDLAQDALVLAWQKLGEFDGVHFGSWVGEIARRLVANERRKEARRSRILSGEVTDLLLRLNPEPDAPLSRLERDEALTALRACLGELPPPGRELIRMRYFDQLTPGAIAGRLGRPSNYVRQSLLRLRRTLLECVEHRNESDGGGRHDRG